MIPLAQRETQSQARPIDKTATKILGISTNLTQRIGENVLKTERLKTNNELNDIQNQVAVINNKYKSENSQDPLNEGNRKRYNEEIEKMYSEKRKNVSSMFLKEYDSSFSQFQSRNKANMDIWAFDQNEKNIITDSQNGIKRDMSTAFSMGSEGNLFDAVTYFENQDKLIQQNLVNIDPQTHSKLYGSYKSDFYTNFINGSMNQNPEKTLMLLKNKNIKEGIEPETYSKLKEATENKLMNARSLAIKKEISSNILKNTQQTRRAIEGKASFTELYNYIEENDISKPTAEYLMRIGGYKISETKKIPVSEQIKAKNDIYNKIELAVEKGDIEDFQNIQNEIYSKVDSNYFSQAEGENMIDTYIVPYAEKVQEANEDYSVKRLFEFGLNVGSRGINEFVNDLTLPGTEKQQNIRRASLRVGLLDNFSSQLNKEISLNPDIERLSDLDKLPRNERIELLNRARDNSIKEYAKSLDIETENRPINDIKLNIKQNEINQLRKENYDILDNTYKRNNQRSFVSVALYKGKYLGLTPNGSTVQITKEEYEKLKGK